MKAILALTIIGSLVLGTAIYNMSSKKFGARLQNDDIPTNVYDSWTHWKQRYGKSYGVDAEEQYRLRVYYDNFNMVGDSNNKGYKYTLALNQFADMTIQEFKKAYLGSQRPHISNTKTVKLPTDNLPQNVDWESYGGVTPIKDQGQCGSCWSFSTSGALEGAHFASTGSLTPLSEQQFMDCSKDLGNMSCSGGYINKAYDYAVANGVMSESDYPYYALDRNVCQFDATKVVYTPKSYTHVPVDDSDALKAAAAKGPVSVSVAADQLMFYDSGIFHYSLCLTEVDHGVLLTGYGVEDVSGTQYWRVKNSWGTTWGEDGYFRLLRPDGAVPTICGLTKDSYYPNL